MTEDRHGRRLKGYERAQLGIMAIIGLVMIAYFSHRWKEIHEPVPDLRERLKQSGVVIRAEVKGEVESPGVYELAPGATVLDLLRVSGASDAERLPKDWRDVPLADGAQVQIWSGPDGQPHLAVNRMSGDTLGLLFIRFDLNEATFEDLTSLPGIGDQTARDILAYRQQHGPFRSVEDLREVSGIGDKTIEALRYRVAVGRPAAAVSGTSQKASPPSAAGSTATDPSSVDTQSPANVPASPSSETGSGSSTGGGARTSEQRGP